MSLIDMAEAAVHDRMISTPAFVSALGHSSSDRRIKHGWPQQVLASPESDAFPLSTYFAPSDQKVHTGRGTVRIDIHLFAWHSGADGGHEKLAAIDNPLETAFDETVWTFAGDRFYCLPTDARRIPGEGPDAPLGRVRSLRVGVN